MMRKRKTSPISYKSYGEKPCNVDESNRKVSGYLAAFGNIDSDGDIIVKGAFAKSLQERGVNSSTKRKIAYLWQHKMSEPIGRFTELREDDYGLYFEAELDEIPLADRVMKQYQSGTLNQHSIGFNYVWDKTEVAEDNDNVFILKEVNLFEGSVVTMGSNENTPYLGMKGVKLEAEGQVLTKETEAFLRSLTPEQEHEARTIISKHIALTEAKEPLKALNVPSEPQIDIKEALKTLKFFNNGTERS